ncbi:MAG: thioredoxin family protein [Flavobacterium sp.]|nr:thioredoxin family protein [Flavobacterium sp.]
MKKLIAVIISIFAFANVNAQILNPVKWSSKTEKISETEFNLIVSGKIDDDWHVYSQFTPDGGSLPMMIEFINQKNNFELVGKTKESPYKKGFNDVFGVNEFYFEKAVTLTQKVKIINTKIDKIKMTVDYQVCKESCINDKKTFVFEIPVSKIENSISNTTNDSIKTEGIVPVKVDSIKKKDNKSPENIISESPKSENRSLWSIFIFAFLGGFAALLTPCVFPMIPMTVSFFTKQSKTKSQGIRNAIFYGLSIIIIYVLLGTLVTWIFGADALNALSTNVYFNVIFFALLIFFAASFLGAFEIMLPNSWANKIDSQADRGGIIGILFMALALAIVSFSCTGPIVGTLLVESASKGGIAPIIGMLGFSLALSLPFMLFAMFPGWLNSLPKSGGWLNTVKVFLGFLELALAFKFLSNADLVLQLHLLEREVFLAIWIAIFGTLALYLFGKITLPHDNPLPSISVNRLFLGLITLSFTIYLIPGLWGAPLKLINAFPPPMEYSESPYGVDDVDHKIIQNNNSALPLGAKYGPHNIIVFDDYDKGLAYAKNINKPILLDFTGYACVNCRKMENNVWSDERILKILNNEVVLISLFVDDKREMPKSEQYISKTSGENLETFGDKWTDFMINTYKTNTQPLYVVTDLNGKNLNDKIPTTSYNPDISFYESWLKTSISNFKK